MDGRNVCGVNIRVEMAKGSSRYVAKNILAHFIFVVVGLELTVVVMVAAIAGVHHVIIGVIAGALIGMCLE